jgi:hypothetical protein
MEHIISIHKQHHPWKLIYPEFIISYSLQEYTQCIKKHILQLLFPRHIKCLTPNLIKGIMEHIYYHVIGRQWLLLRPEFPKQVASVIFNSF